MEFIKTFLEELAPVSDRDWLMFSQTLNKTVYKKNDVILEAGAVEEKLSFLESGIVRFYIKRQREDLTFSFTFRNSFVSAYDSFLTRSPSMYSVAAISDCILWQLTFDDLQDLYTRTSIGNAIGRKIAEELYVAKTKRELALLRDDAKTRYLTLLAEQQDLFRHIPLKYLASYIGVKPQSLSRIRRQIS